MVRSLILRSAASFARPRWGFSLLREGFEVRFTLTTVAQASRDDSTNSPTALGSICEDDGERDALRETDAKQRLSARGEAPESRTRRAWPPAQSSCERAAAGRQLRACSVALATLEDCNAGRSE